MNKALQVQTRWQVFFVRILLLKQIRLSFSVLLQIFHKFQWSEISGFEFNTYVQKLMKDKKIQIYQAPVRDEIIVKMKIPGPTNSENRD